MAAEPERVAVVIEDDADIRNLLAAILDQAGFSCHTCESGQQGIAAVRAYDPILTTLDISLPGIDGFEVARQIRAFSSTYIIMLSARDEEIDTLMGLDAGADDYLTKPFRPRELRARIEAMLRRYVTPVQAAAAVAAPAAAAGGARIELLASNANGTPNVASLQVVRAETQGFKELDEIYVLTHLAQAQRLIYGKEPPRVTSIVLQLHRTEQTAKAEARLAALLPTLGLSQPLAVMDFRTLNPFYTQSIQLFDTIFGFIFVLIGGIVLFNVSNTMNTAVVERTVEIGTLRAIGLRQGGIRRLFLVEGFLLGVSGAVVGLLLALGAAFVINRMGLTWVPPSAAEPVPLTVRVWAETRMMVGTTLGLIAIATVSAWYPATRAARLGVVDALRHV